ncbi:substrate-binding domain-containing protein [Micromonospora sp. RTGN7]|uniref:substrate-binding domain-containing protein n=1 Tax=Micromonospora sp. RTGN7 TaxID=3016526 RepID=UPI0029FEC800|nr:substrate-binding domain-containing protein [Micromonospora sp. RTGN7]
MVSGRHRMRINLHGTGAVASATALVVVVAGGWFGYRQLAQPACSGQVQLTVGASPELAPAVGAAAAQWMADGAAVGGTCVAVDVSAAEPVDVAATAAAEHGVQLPGVGRAEGGAANPDVWVPDSSTWLLRIKNAGASAFTPGNGASIARSPVLVAVPEPVASSRLGWPNKTLTWPELLLQVSGSKPLRAGIVDPSQDAVGFSTALSLTATDEASGNAAPTANPGMLRALATGRSALRDDLLARFPGSSDPTAIVGGLDAAVLSEEDVMAYNERKPPIPLAAVYLDPPPMPLDYPYAVLPGATPAKQAAAKALFEVLTGPGFRDRLAERSLRAPDGSWGDGFKTPQGAPGATKPGRGGDGANGPAPTALERATSSWSIATQSVRVLCLIDVSGSMKRLAPTGDGITRGQATLAAARRGLDLFNDSSPVGLWTFSTRLVGNQDHRELAPINPLSVNRARIEQELTTIRPGKGGLGLYDTMLAAYREAQNGWSPGRLNAVVVFTAGGNDDDDGISQQKLLTELKRIVDFERPVPVVIIGVGRDVSLADLEPITKVTGGGSFVTEDPTRSGDLFLKAIVLRPSTAR